MESRVRKRFALVALAIALGFALVTARLGKIILLDGTNLASIASRQHNYRVVTPEQRGDITDRNGSPLASSIMASSVFAHPERLQARVSSTRAIATSLALPADAISGKLQSDRPFVWLRRAATPKQAEAVSALQLPGIGIRREAKRCYPQGTLAAHVVGFTGIDLHGLEGAELFFDELLRGVSVAERVERDAKGRRIWVRTPLREKGRQGAMLELTIDAPLQHVAEQALAEGVKEAEAKAGTAIVLDPWTGELLSLAVVPTFNPNSVNLASPSQVRNRAIADIFEPGSTIKPILVAAAIEAGVVTPRSAFFCEQGRMKVGRRTIHDHHPHGWLSVPEILQVSSNIGVAKIVEQLGAKRYHQYLKRFGFGAKLGIDLPGEVRGMVADPDKWSAIRLVNAAFGQGIAATPLQVASAFAALANGGNLMRPYVARRAVSAAGEVIWQRSPEKIGRAIKSATAEQVTAMLRLVVAEGGTAEKARVEGFAVAGKTGTAQKVDPATGRYSADARVASFAGYLPAGKPRVVILVVIDEPSRGRYGGVVAAPVFRRIALEAMRRLGVSPEAGPPTEVRGRRRRQIARRSAISGMPSFIGMSLRQAVVEAQEAGWQVQVRGSGYVMAQVPGPGAPASPGRALVLSLAPRVDRP